MMGDNEALDVATNPFSALFPSEEQAEEYRRQHNKPVSDNQGDKGLTVQRVTCQTNPCTFSLKHGNIDFVSESSGLADRTTHTTKQKNETTVSDPQMVNDLLQRVFLITVDPGR